MLVQVSRVCREMASRSAPGSIQGLLRISLVPPHSPLGDGGSCVSSLTLFVLRWVQEEAEARFKGALEAYHALLPLAAEGGAK